MFGIAFPFGGFANGRFSFQAFRQKAVTDPSRKFSSHIRLSRSILYFTATSISAQPPCVFCRWNVVTCMRKVAPCDIYRVHIVVSCCVCALWVGGSVPRTRSLLVDIFAHILFSGRDIAPLCMRSALAVALLS